MYFPKSSGFFFDSYCVLDLETTGLRPASCEIIEIGILKIRQGKPVAKMDVLIKPTKLSIPAFITNLTGISTEMVMEAPSIDEVSYWIYDFIQGGPILGYNVLFDLGFLKEHTRTHLPEPPFLDVLPLARICYPELPRHSLSHMTAHLHLYQNTHRAIDDCAATYQLYELCKKKLEGKSASQIQHEIDQFRQNRRPGRGSSNK